jgi:membrane fusion protein (multidrug efflux system)
MLRGDRQGGLSHLLEDRDMDEEEKDAGNGAAGEPWWRRNLVWLAVGASVVVAVVGYSWWRYAAAHESTEDAYVDGASAFVSPQVPGRVAEVLVAANRHVAVGEPLVRLDPVDYQIAVTHAEAEVARMRSRLQAARVSVDYSRDRTNANVQEAEARLAVLQETRDLATSDLARRHAEVKAAEADLETSHQDLARIRTLYDKGGVSRRELDHAVSREAVMGARLDVARAYATSQEHQIEAIDKQLEEVQAQIEEARAERLSTRMKTLDAETLEAELQQAEASLAQARLDLDHTEIRAPIDGFVSRKSVEVGNFVQPGQALMAIVPLERVWVEANFKEDQLELIRVGQPARIVADTYPDHAFQGHVDSLSSGTGDAFSLLPPVNATGNWIKVTRRVPVKIVLESPPPAEYPLRIGMSTTVTVDVRDQTGARLDAPGEEDDGGNEGDGGAARRQGSDSGGRRSPGETR